MLMLICLFGAMTFAGEGDEKSEAHQSIPAAQFKVQMAKEEGILLDLRTPAEYNDGFVKGAHLMDYYNEGFKRDLGTLDKEKTYYIYCRSGGRSGKTLKLMKEMGFKKVYDMSDGFMGWLNNQFPFDIPK